jgi:hypothetical protein
MCPPFKATNCQPLAEAVASYREIGGQSPRFLFVCPKPAIPFSFRSEDEKNTSFYFVCDTFSMHIPALLLVAARKWCPIIARCGASMREAVTQKAGHSTPDTRAIGFDHHFQMYGTT